MDRLNRQQEEICEEILAEFPGISKAREKKIVSDVMLQLAERKLEDLENGQPGVRNRRTKSGYPMIGMTIITLELYKKKNSIDLVAQELSPSEYGDPKKRKALRERVRSYLKYAQREIDALIP